MAELGAKPRPVCSRGLALNFRIAYRCTMDRRGPWKARQVAHCVDGETEAQSRSVPSGDTQE